MNTDICYLDTHLLFEKGGVELLTALRAELAVPLTLLPEPWQQLTGIAKCRHEIAAAAQEAIDHITAHPQDFIVQKEPDFFGADSLPAACLLLGRSKHIAVISNDMRLSLDILHCCAENGADKVQIYRVENGKLLALDAHLQSVQARFVQTALKRDIFWDSAAITRGHLAERMEALGIFTAMKRAQVHCCLTAATRTMLQDSAAAPLLERLQQEQLLQMTPTPDGVEEAVLFKGLRMSAKGSQLVYTTQENCEVYALKGLKTAVNSGVEFAVLQEDGRTVLLSPEAPEQTPAAPAKETALPAERPHQYMKPQTESCVIQDDEAGLFRLLQQGSNPCWALIAAIRRNKWEMVHSLVKYVQESATHLHAEAFVTPVSFILKESTPKRRGLIARALEQVLPQVNIDETCAAAADKLHLLAEEQPAGELKQALEKLLQLLQSGHMDISTLPTPSAEEPPAEEEDDTAKLLQQAKKALETDRESAAELAWKAANAGNILALRFLAEEIGHPAALCAWGRFLQTGGKHDRFGQQNDRGKQTIPADKEKAFRMLMSSAQSGYPNGCLQAAQCLHRGIGTEPDEQRAQMLYQMALRSKNSGILNAAYKGLIELFLKRPLDVQKFTVAHLADMLGVDYITLITRTMPNEGFTYPAQPVSPERVYELLRKYAR